MTSGPVNYSALWAARAGEEAAARGVRVHGSFAHAGMQSKDVVMCQEDR